MYQGGGLGSWPYVMGSNGAIVDCSQHANFLQGNCWNPFAQTYSMLDYTTQSDLGPAATAATVSAAAADAQATIDQQCADDPSSCAIATSGDPYIASLLAGGQQALDDVQNIIPSWLWVVLIGSSALLLFTAMKR